MAKQWLVERWETLLPALAASADEAEIQRLCEDELSAWRARPSMKQERSLR